MTVNDPPFLLQNGLQKSDAFKFVTFVIFIRLKVITGKIRSAVQSGSPIRNISSRILPGKTSNLTKK